MEVLSRFIGEARVSRIVSYRIVLVLKTQVRRCNRACSLLIFSYRPTLYSNYQIKYTHGSKVFDDKKT